MKRFLVAVLLTVICCTMLASCGASPQDAATNTSQPTIPPASMLPIPIGESEHPNNELLPLEIKEYGYGIAGKGYIYISVILHNPNPDYCIEFPSFRVTARDADGLVLGSEDQTLSVIYPKQDFCYAGQMFQVDDIPTSVEVEVLAPDDYQILNPQHMDHPTYVPLEIVNSVVRDDRLMGEISNSNDYDIDSAIVTVLYRDENGEIVGGNSTFINKVSASATTPFDFSIYEDLVTNNYEVYANIWV